MSNRTEFQYSEETGAPVEWLIRLRWIAIIGTITTVSLSQHVLFLFPEGVSPFLWSGVATLALSNLFYIRFKGFWKDPHHCILFQISSDLAVLTYLLHFSGDLENPFFILYIFHCILACLILPRRLAIYATMVVAGFFLTLSWIGGSFKYFEHYPILLANPALMNEEKEFFHVSHELPYIAGISAAFSTLLVGTSYFVITLVRQLRESHEKLVRREKLSVLGQLVAYIAHEVNNPIGVISARAKLVRSGSPKYDSPEFVKETFEIIDRQADRVENIVKNLLGFLKYDSKPKSYVAINPLLEEVLSITESRISKRGIVVERFFSDGLPPIRAVRENLVHIFLNIINNAMDAMPVIGILRLETKVSGSWVEVLVSDTGEGIAKENLKKIFDPLYSTKENGTGLGLTLCHSLASSAGGEIRVESTPRKGSVFTVRFPY